MKHRATTVTDVVSIQAHPLKRVTSRTVHHALVIQTIKQTVQLPEKVHGDVMTTQLLTRVADSSRCVEHIINPLQHRERHVKAVKTEDSMKPISGSQRMKSGSTDAFDQCLPIGQ
jgi:hypothetical protein